MSTPLPLDDFVGRDAELAMLQKAYASRSAGLWPVYGRRRVGKTELLLRFVADKPAIYFSAGRKLRNPQLSDFMRAAAAGLGTPALSGAAPDSWESALRLAVAAAPRDRRLVLVLDEFQWLCESSPELPSVIQRLWDLEWQRRNDLMLVLCGSVIGFMEREVLGTKSPLHGRRTGSLHLQPFGFREAGLFQPRWSAEERARAWFVCGGIPAYLRRFDRGRSVLQNIATEVFEPDSFFHREPEFLLREELADVRQSTSILECIALGRRSHTEIARAVGLGSSALAPHLKSLVSLGYLERLEPVSPSAPPRTAVQYVVADPLLRFWFRFLEPNASLLRRADGASLVDQLVVPQWEAFCGEGFERLCRLALADIYASERVTGAFRIGAYWNKHVQVDVVGIRRDRWIDLGECKWGNVESVAAVARELEAKRTHYPAEGHSIRQHVFVRRRARTRQARRSDVLCHDLESLYAEPA